MMIPMWVLILAGAISAFAAALVCLPSNQDDADETDEFNRFINALRESK